MTDSKQQIWLVYDGDCPLCRTFAKVVKIREAAGELQLVNAREPHPILQEVNARQFNLDQGIVVKLNESFYHGADALHVLSLLSTNQTWFNRLNAFIFRSRVLTKVTYPVLKSIRNLLLWLNRKTKINNTRKSDTPIFQSVFGADWDKLPIVLRAHYANRPYSNDVVSVTGKMRIEATGVFRLLMPVFKIFKILVPYCGEDIPVRVDYRSDMQSRKFSYYRVFDIGGKSYQFQSYMLPQENNVVIEIMRFGLGWRMKYVYSDGKINMQFVGYIWKCFGVLVPLPFALLMGKVYLEEEAVTEDIFRMNMVMTHSLFGKYIYAGEFKLLRE